MAALYVALAGCFWWFIDVLLCFMVSCTVVVVLCAVMFFLWKHFRPVIKEDASLDDVVTSFEKLTYRGKLTMIGSPALMLLLALLLRVWEIVVSKSPAVKECNPPLPPPPNWGPDGMHGVSWDEGEEGVMLSDIIPTWFAPFWVVSDYELHVAVVPLRLTKLLFVSAFILSIPFIMIAVNFISKSDRPLLRLTLWTVEVYHKWSKMNDTDKLLRLMYVEYTIEQYLKTIVKTTLAGMEKEKEVEKLEQKLEELQKNIAEMNQWMDSERRLANKFELKNHEIEKKLDSEKQNGQSIKNRCLELEKLLESERKLSTTWERKFNDLQKKVEKRPVVVKQQISGDDIMCVICMERKRQYLLRPCNHYCVCNQCKSTLQNKCPLCRKLIRSYEKIFIN